MENMNTFYHPISAQKYYEEGGKLVEGTEVRTLSSKKSKITKVIDKNTYQLDSDNKFNYHISQLLVEVKCIIE